MTSFVTKFEQAAASISQAAASISSGVGGYTDFLLLHFGTYVTPRSFGEFLLFCIAAIVVAQIVQVRQQLARMRDLPEEVHAEINRLQNHMGRLSRTLAVLRTDQASTTNESN